MPTHFFRLCLLFAFLSCAGCLGGPKVNPPEFTDERTLGSGSGGTGSQDGTSNTAMDSGTPAETTNPPAGSGGQIGIDDQDKQSDAASMEDDDAGSIHEP